MRKYHNWGVKELNYIKSRLSELSDYDLARAFKVSMNALIKVRLRHNIYRTEEEDYIKPCRLNPPKPASKYSPYQLVLDFVNTQKQMHQSPYESQMRIRCRRLLLRALVYLGRQEPDRAKGVLNDAPSEIYESILRICESRPKDCLNALATYVLRAVEIVKNDTYDMDLKEEGKDDEEEVQVLLIFHNLAQIMITIDKQLKKVRSSEPLSYDDVKGIMALIESISPNEKQEWHLIMDQPFVVPVTPDKVKSNVWNGIEIAEQGEVKTMLFANEANPNYAYGFVPNFKPSNNDTTK